MFENFLRKTKKQKSFFLGLAVFYLFTTLHATPTTMNYIEMATALAPVPFDIVAQRYDQQGNIKKAASFHIATDLLSILNKIIFFYNNIQGQEYQLNGPSYFQKDMIAQGSFLVRDLTKFYQHFSEFRRNPEYAENDDNPNAQTGQIIIDTTQPSTLSNLLKVYGFPTLKGLTAFAMACTQEYATSYSGKQERNVATAAYSLVRICEEYQMAQPKSSIKKLLMAALCINVIWLGYELKTHYQHNSKITTKHGECMSCGEAEDHVIFLPCGHGNCKEGWKHYIDGRYKNNGESLNRTPCPACQAYMTRDQVKQVIDNDPKIMRRFDKAHFDLLKSPEKLDEAALDFLHSQGGMQCPGCNKPIIRGEACPHMTCSRADGGCGTEFCIKCGGVYINHVHPNGVNHLNCVPRPGYVANDYDRINGIA